MKTDLMKLALRQLLDLFRTKGADLVAIAARLKAMGAGDLVLVGWEDVDGTGCVRTAETEIVSTHVVKTTRLSGAGITTALSRMP